MAGKRKQKKHPKLGRGRPTASESAALKRLFLEKFSQVGTVAGGVRLVNAEREQLAHAKGKTKFARMDRSTHNLWLKNKNKKYATEFALAKEQANDLLEAEARRRAMIGVERPVIRKGAAVMVPDKSGNLVPLMERMYSDTLLIFIMKGAMPDKYRERLSHEHSGPQAGAIPMTLRVVYEEQGNGKGGPVSE